MGDDDLLQIVQYIDDEGSDLTDWEVDFIDRMLKLLEGGGTPAPKEVSIIYTIHKERC